MLWSIDTRQNKIFADQYQVIILWAQVYTFLMLTADQVLIVSRVHLWFACFKAGLFGN